MNPLRTSPLSPSPFTPSLLSPSPPSRLYPLPPVSLTPYPLPPIFTPSLHPLPPSSCLPHLPLLSCLPLSPLSHSPSILHTSNCSPEVYNSLYSKCQVEEDKEPVAIVSHATRQPQAMVIESKTTSIAELAVFGPVWNHYLR